jgi:Arc/MetJ-type ribon-helix-helix transcriptional regulator
MPKAKERVSMSVSLPIGLVEELDKMVDAHLFGSRSEALRYGAHLDVLFQKRLHYKTDGYAYDEITDRLKRGKNVS